jgi:hypothetical protein
MSPNFPLTLSTTVGSLRIERYAKQPGMKIRQTQKETNPLLEVLRYGPAKSCCVPRRTPGRAHPVGYTATG